jgi:hypothetical protein
MASPDIPWEQRPWRQQRGLGEDDFKEECRGWDVNELVFSAALWGTYQVGGRLGGCGCGRRRGCGSPCWHCHCTIAVCKSTARCCRRLPAAGSCLLAHSHLTAPACCFVQPLMRADFTLFDEYDHRHAGAAPFDFPLTAFWGSRDRRIKQAMVQVRGRGSAVQCRLLCGTAGQRVAERERALGQASNCAASWGQHLPQPPRALLL